MWFYHSSVRYIGSRLEKNSNRLSDGSSKANVIFKLNVIHFKDTTWISGTYHSHSETLPYNSLGAFHNHMVSESAFTTRTLRNAIMDNQFSIPCQRRHRISICS